MEDLTFGEQVKIILNRKGMTIKELAELIETTTGKKMSRQNLTQRLGRDNFQEQDMRMIAAILGCPFQLSIFPQENETGERVEELLLKYVKHPRVQPRRKKDALEDGVYQQVLVFDQEPPEEPKADTSKKEEPKSAADAVQKQTEEKADADRLSVPSDTAQEESLLDLEILDPEDSEDLEEPEDLEILDTGYGIDRFDKKETSDSISKTRRFDKNEILAAAERAENQKQASGMEPSDVKKAASGAEERDMTIGELYMIHKELDQLEETIHPRPENRMEVPVITASEPELEAVSEPIPEPEPELIQEPVSKARVEKEEVPDPDDFEPVIRYEDAEEDLELGEMNPYTGREYQTNSVRMHPSRIGYVQVYDRFQHGWTDMTEWAFLGYQERKKTLLGRDYEPPIYLD